MCWFFLLRGEQVTNPCIIYVLVYSNTRNEKKYVALQDTLVTFEIYKCLFVLLMSAKNNEAGKMGIFRFL